MHYKRIGASEGYISCWRWTVNRKNGLEFGHWSVFELWYIHSNIITLDVLPIPLEMATELEVLPAVTTGKGQTARFFVNDSKEPTSKDSWRMQVEYDGQPESTLFEVPPDWHALHDEYWTMLEGRMLATVDGKRFTLNAGDETLCIPRCHLRGLKAFKGERAVLTESSVPSGEFKQW